MTQEPKKYKHGKLYDLNISDLLLDTAQPRKYFDEEALAELKASIEKHGVLQPVLVRSGEKGGFLVVSGERRFQASVKAGLTTIPALLTEGDPVEISIVENLLRENLTAIEEAEAIERLRATHNYQLKDLSGILGKAESTVCEILSLNKLPEDVKDECRNNPKASRALLVKIAREHSQEKMRALYQKYKDVLTGEAAKVSRRSLPTEVQGDFTFVNRCTRRINALEIAMLDDAQLQELAADLQNLRSAAFKKLKAMKARAQRI
ncbi:ParB/RepB/Spo0J family partition protein [Geomonas sp. RF6]|uniref:ParB/RepB/Spo0J family partition protein n=1 Tax=Geomonas sp. RF6 TaxID=2897342 RepID=UPI001E2A460E|nr:ParB/RepB/Spo0J family partition protein [Geomonas sp. RF6]UFS68672.1 ParB/RepB/Spo0J family partition protein [Geomonas sp. RF6]